MNTQKAPFNEVKVREAMAYAINKEAYIQVVMNGYGSVATSMVGEEVQHYKGNDPYSYDPEKAKELLKEAGYPDGFTTTLMYSNTTANQKKAEFYKQQLSEVGIDLELNGMENAVLNEKVQGADCAGADVYKRQDTKSTCEVEACARIKEEKINEAFEAAAEAVEEAILNSMVCLLYTSFLWLRKYRREPHGLPGKERRRNHRAALSFWCRYAAGRRTTVFCAHSFQRLPSLHGFRLDDAHNRRSPLLRGMYPYTGNGGRFRGRWQSLRGWRFPAAAVHRPVQWQPGRWKRCEVPEPSACSDRAARHGRYSRRTGDRTHRR